jgi:hypothetical protein
MQMLGVYLEFSSLIIAALETHRLRWARPHAIANASSAKA